MHYKIHHYNSLDLLNQKELLFYLINLIYKNLPMHLPNHHLVLHHPKLNHQELIYHIHLFYQFLFLLSQILACIR